MISLWLSLPSISWFVNLFVPRRIHPAILFVVVGVTCYVLMTASILTEFEDYEHELLQYDLNRDCAVTGSELTPAAMEIQDKIVHDTGRSFGPIFAAPITGVWVALNFAVLYGGEWVVRHFTEAD